MLAARNKEAYRLLHDGCLALSRVEANGIRIDVDRLEKTIGKVGRRVEKLSADLRDGEEWKIWKKRFGGKASMGSRAQLGVVLAKMGFATGKKTKTGKVQVNESALESVDLPFVKAFLEVEKLKKLLGTYLKGVKKEVVDGLLHPSFNLNLVRTFRSSSSDPNFQNIPIRDPMMGKLIRSCFVPRDGHVLVEADFKALEVNISACMHRDPVMIEYIENDLDLHKEMAAVCYMLDESQVSKDVRFYAKSEFVFPEFYGSYFMQIAPNLWDAIDRHELKVDGMSLKDHLRSKGIAELGDVRSKWGTGREEGESGWIDTEDGTFVEHIRQVEQDFWERFHVYAQWKIDWFNLYLRRGWFDLPTGFREYGIYKRNDVINHPVQGSAFHCLLWCLIRLVKWTEKNKMRSKVVGQIHDSIVADVHRDELDDFVGMMQRVMKEDIRRIWDWIVVPLGIEIEVGVKNWFEKERMA